MNAADLRQSFLDFFKNKGHKIISSASLLPESPNLLFTNAGMNQFVPILLGERAIQFSRIADTQKCIRAGGKHNDLEDVGFDTYHHTFFEMLGNWSFGDYFKKDAIEFAWELLIKIWHFPRERLYVTVYFPGEGDPSVFDQEAYDIWKCIFEAENLNPETHILKFGKKENFWMMGDTGPCGPCSEIHIDLTENGDTKGCLVNGDSPLCIEIWNLVFMQFNAKADGSFPELKAKHVDTGMGLERVAGIMKTTRSFSDFSQSPSNYDGDLFVHIFNQISALSGKIYKGTVAKNRESMSEQEKIDFGFRVIADHIRTLTFAIADGILPGNEGRHYVLRRILRRAVIFAKRLALPQGSFSSLADVVIERMSSVFPELRRNREILLQTISSEEAMFEKTLGRGILLLEDICSKSHRHEISGHDAFTLYDTYGFPFDLTQLMAKEKGFKVDERGFQESLEKQRERARGAQKKSQIVVAAESNNLLTEFVGYRQFENIHAKILRIINDGNVTYVITDKTPFYAEMGGEIGDTGEMIYRDKKMTIGDTVYDSQKNILHKIEQSDRLTQDINFQEGKAVILNIDVERRKEIQRHHTATHILHAALREILGQHIRQCGSCVDDHGLRFDFNHFAALSPENLEAIELWVNAVILKNLPVTWQEMPFAEIPTGCIAHFNEKYGERVRIVAIGGDTSLNPICTEKIEENIAFERDVVIPAFRENTNVSMELCGGCHAYSTGELGFLKIVKESAIAAGIRRIEAVVGRSAKRYIDHHVKIVGELAQQFSVKTDEVLAKIQQLQFSKHSIEHRLRMVLEKSNRRSFDEACQQSILEDGLKKTRMIFEIDNVNDLRALTTSAMKQEGCDVVVFGGNLPEGAVIMISCSQRAIDTNHNAAHMAKKIAEQFGGKGGGSPSFGMVNIGHRLESKDMGRL